MKKVIISAIVIALCLVIGGGIFLYVRLDKDSDLTLASGKGFIYGKNDYKPMTKVRELSDIYFPEGILDTGLGMYIFNGEDWLRTDTKEGKAAFDVTKPTFVSIHGMGGNARADAPENYYARGYNVLCFMWGCYAGEENAKVTQIVNKVWLDEFDWVETSTKETKHGARWETVDGRWEEEDVCDASVIEIFCAYYFEFFSYFPKYEGTSIHIFGHSYGGMISIGATSLLTTAFKCGVLPAYMLPDMVSMLDPYMMRCTDTTIPWLGDNTPNHGNICEVAYQAALDCQKLGITVRVFRFTKSVGFPATFHNFADNYEGDLNISYWNFINNTIYCHLDDDSVGDFSSLEAQHNYAWDWFTSFYTGAKLYDSAATKTQEQAFCFGMDYDASFARTGIKYNVYLNGTLRNTDDDILSSFYRTYSYDGLSDKYEHSDVLESETAETRANLTGKAKIAGFVYLDRNGNGKMDERVRDHLSGANVTVTDSTGKEICSTTTTINGYYEIEVAEEGEYTVKVAMPRGYELSGEKDTAVATIVDGQHQLALNHFGATKK